MTTHNHQAKRTRRRTAGALPFLACAVTALAACSSGGSGTGPGSAPIAHLSGSPAAAAGATPLTVAQSDRDFINFARCMRAHGVQMSDPVHLAGHSGLSIDMPTRDAASARGYAACIHFIQPIINMKLAGAASQATPHLAQLTAYARCMRSHDISMLDPTSFGALNLGTVPGITSNFGRYSPQFRAADAACRHLLPAGVHDDGTGP